jgi:surface carbohydrate biosynthesis protein
MIGSAIDLKPRVWLLIPIETKAREYHAKLLLSCVATEAGFGAIMGHMDRLMLDAPLLPRGIFFLNNIATINETPSSRYRKMGHRVVAWCEEGIAYRNRQSYRHERVSPQVMQQVERFFAWGEYQAEDVRLAIGPTDRNKIVPCGSPRLDLLRPEFREFFREEADRIRNRRGRFVLVNTNFHRFNHFLGRGAYLRNLKAAGKVPDAEQEAFFQGWIDFLGDLYNAFVKMLEALSSALPDHLIVLRPHPSEDHAAWQRELAALPNVEVVHEGSVLPWILASEALIHNSCATGIEAFVMGVPVISYRPFRSATYDSFLPNALSREARTEAELLAMVKALIHGDKNIGSKVAGDGSQLARRVFEGLDGPLASDRIVDALKRLQVPARPFARNPIEAWVRKLALRNWPSVRILLSRVAKGPNPLADYLLQKFPSLSLPEVQQDLDRLRRVSGRFESIRVAEIGDMLFSFVASTD